LVVLSRPSPEARVFELSTVAEESPSSSPARDESGSDQPGNVLLLDVPSALGLIGGVCKSFSDVKPEATAFFLFNGPESNEDLRLSFLPIPPRAVASALSLNGWFFRLSNQPASRFTLFVSKNLLRTSTTLRPAPMARLLMPPLRMFRDSLPESIKLKNRT
jgi:hypothetical protein